MNLPPPHNLEAEQAVLSAIMQEPDALLKANDIITTDMFYRPSHIEVFFALLDLYELGEPIDLLSVAERLKVKGKLGAVGGASYLAQLASAVPTAANVVYHSKIIRDKALHRRVLALAQEMETQARAGQDDIPAWLEAIEGGILRVSEGTEPRRSPEIADVVRRIEARWAAARAGHKTHVPTPFWLSDAVPGYYAPHLWICKGYTSFGKSTFLNQLIVSAKEDMPEARLMLCSTEDSAEEKAMMLLSNLIDVPKKYLITGEVRGHEDALAHAKQTLLDWDVLIHDDIRTVAALRLALKKQSLQRGGVDVCFLDYVQLFQAEGGIYERMSTIAIELQALAKEMGVAIVVVSQITTDRSTGAKQGAARGAGELEQSADVILSLVRSDVAGQERELTCVVEKNRPFGVTGVRRLMFSERWTRVEAQNI